MANNRLARPIDLSAGRRALLASALKQEGVRARAPDAIPRRAPEDRIPVSFAQQRLWFLNQLSPGNPFYNVASAIRLGTMTNPAILERALNEIVRRHEALRTTFAVVDGDPVQVVAPTLTLPMPIVDLRSLPPAERETEVMQLAAEEACKAFELAKGPLIRATLLRPGDFDYVLLLTLHHIICDGWSMGVFGRELHALYTAFALGRPSPLPEIAVQYPDFAAWQRKSLQGETFSEQLAYWKEQLAGISPFQLLTDFPRPSVSQYVGATHRFQLPASLSTALQTLSQREGATLFMTLLGAFQALLHRYSGQKDIVVGVPIACRSRRELEGLIGFFVNTLVMRADFGLDPGFRDLLRDVQKTALSAYAHQDLPFEKLVEELQPERNLGRNPLFQVTFQFFTTATAQGQQTDLSGASALAVQKGTAIFDLACNLWQTGPVIEGGIEYSTALFRPETIARFAGHFQALLEGIVASPDLTLSRLPLLSPAERGQLLDEWNQTAADFPRDGLVHEKVEAQAERNPAALAVADENGQWSYGELNTRASRLASSLRKAGVGPETVVAVCLDRGAHLITALLAVLKAGGAYLPLDPCNPRERLRFILEDSKAPIILTNVAIAPELVAGKARVICLDDEMKMLDPLRAENLGHAVTGDNLAYVIYTSGSTGKPKGAEITHASLMNLVAWHQCAYHITPAERATQIAAPSYDASVWEIWPYLAAGASLHFVPAALRADPPALIRWLDEQAITISFLPTPLAEAVLELVWPREIALRKLLTGGDEMHRPPPPGLPFDVINHYGPTEYTVIATAGLIDPSTTAIKPHIGKPIANTQLHVLDRHLQPVPVGVAGELCIGGVGLARGYLNRPELTTEKFIANPFSDRPGERLYRSGDLVRYLPDGNIDFLGRIDQQVKLRGFRIETGEIETVLRQHPAIKEAVVVVHEDRSAQKRLVAYLLPHASAPDGTAQNGNGEIDAEQVQYWRALYDDTYGKDSPNDDPLFNIIGWSSSYTGQPIPPDEMRQWVDNTLARIRSLRPRRVLEIGCGTGLLLFGLAGECEEYTGLDFSPAALAYLRKYLTVLGPAGERVKLLQRTADDLSGLAPDFDLVILNSVVQYFPSVEYFVRVLDGVIRLVQPGGGIFLGDLRHLSSLEAFHLDVELFRASDNAPVESLRETVRKRLALEQELVIDPALFEALKARFPMITQARVEPKRGDYLNELSRFRYDATLFINREVPPVRSSEVATIDWQSEALDLERLRRRLEENRGILVVKRVPNARLTHASQALQLSAEENGPQTAGELRAKAARAPGVSPEAIWRLGESAQYHVQLRWAGAGADDCVDALFAPGELNGGESLWFEETRSPAKPWQVYANRPLQGLFARRLAPELRRFLEEQLPDHMIPASFIVLESLPLTAHGKIDRRALPDPSFAASRPDSAYVAPRTPLEKAVATLWSVLLNVPDIGAEDNFFTELGGHSLLATQLMSRVRDQFHLDLPLRVLFEKPTVAGLAAAIAAAQGETNADSAAPETLITRAEPRRISEKISDLSEEEVDTMLRGLLAKTSKP
jgi:amino acid adenylation domain-containing protein